jgi:hypothetical protein
MAPKEEKRKAGAFVKGFAGAWRWRAESVATPGGLVET